MAIGGSLLSAYGTLEQGKEQYKAAKFQANQLRQNANQAEGAGQRDAQVQMRQSALTQSRALAVAGASGAGAVDPDVLRIISGLAGEGQLAADTAMYNANESARGMRNQAAVGMYEAKQAKRASKLAALTTMLGGAGNAAMAGSKFNNGGWFGQGSPSGYGGYSATTGGGLSGFA
jgi:hypothetical protein